MNRVSSYADLPIAMSAEDVACALGISRANAYVLMRKKGFPTLFIGKRMTVPKDLFLKWVQEQVAS